MFDERQRNRALNRSLALKHDENECVQNVIEMDQFA